MTEKRKLRRILTPINILGLFFGMYLLTSCSIKEQEGCRLVDSIYYDTDSNPYLKKRYCKETIHSQYWIMNKKSIILPLEPTIEATVFNNDQSKWLSFVENNLKWPEEHVEGKVLVALYIDMYGSILDKRVVKSIPSCVGCNKEAIELIEKLPKVSPAIYDNKLVNSIKYIYIPFKLNPVIN